jgi:hypothetical protein
MASYLGPDELKELIDDDGVFRCTVTRLEREIIAGRPQLVMYVIEDPRGIIVHRKLYEDLTREYGHCEVADRFFQTEGLQ